MQNRFTPVAGLKTGDSISGVSGLNQQVAYIPTKNVGSDLFPPIASLQTVDEVFKSLQTRQK